MSAPIVLVVDDEPAIQHAFRRALRDQPLTVISAGTAAEAITRFEADRPDVVVLDVRLPDATGLETFARLHAVDARVPIVLITGHGTTDLAIEAFKEGVYDYLLKPLDLQELRTLIDRAVRSSRMMRVPVLAEEGTSPGVGDLLIGRCPAMQEVYKAIGRVARQNVTVLILGESGTGKELVARAIYQHGTRAGKPFLAVNCAAIPEALLESELFGHERGAFTGADRKRIGKFEQCHGGTLFLDEVGDMTPATQTKILRLLQEQRFERVGGDETIVTDVRILAATNAPLERMVAEGRFRRDLYFRLNVFQIDLPPLRNRGEDLGLLVRHYLARFGKELGKPVHEVPAETLELLARYSWPGNVRELQSTLKQALLQMPGSILLPEYLPATVRTPGSPPVPEATTTPVSGEAFDWDRWVAERLASQSENLYAEGIELLERELLVRVLRHTAGNQLQAARLLGITRGSLRTKIRALGINIGRSVWSGDEPGEA